MRHFDQQVMARETRCAISTGGGVNAPVRPKGWGATIPPVAAQWRGRHWGRAMP